MQISNVFNENEPNRRIIERNRVNNEIEREREVFKEFNIYIDRC